MDEMILGLVGVILSALFKYIPALQVWFDAQKNKGLLMLAFVFVVSGGYFGLSCLPIDLGIQVTCDVAGALEMVKAFVAILIGNQIAFLMTPNVNKG